MLLSDKISIMINKIMLLRYHYILLWYHYILLWYHSMLLSSGNSWAVVLITVQRLISSPLRINCSL